jgi:peptidylprolyl isomerase
MKWGTWLALLACLLLGAAGDSPPEQVLAQRGDVKLTLGDVRDLVNRADPALRARLTASPAALTEFVRSRLLRQALLAEARAKGWDQTPEVVQKINEARDDVIVSTYTASLAPLDPAYPSPAELAAAYEVNKSRLMLPRQYHLAQIVLLVPAGAAHEADDEAHRKIADIRAQALRPKADFADLARRLSQDRGSAEHGGDLGWVREDQLVPAVKDAVAGLAENAVSDPVRSPEAWHVLKLLGTRPAGPAALADVKDGLVQGLRQARAQQLTRAYVDDLLRQEPIQLDEIELARALPHP